MRGMQNWCQFVFLGTELGGVGGKKRRFKNFLTTDDLPHG